MAGNALSRFPLLVRSLCDPSVYDHPVEDLRVLETHISYVVLTGPYAYKIKKPVELSFLDFSTVEKRKHYCFEELRLNRRFSPDLYLAVIAITGSTEAPVLNGPGEVIDYVLKMVQFDTRAQLESVLKEDHLDTESVQVLAEHLAQFHRSVDKDMEGDFGTPEVVQRCIKDNFSEIAPCVKSDCQRAVGALEEWVDEQLRARWTAIAHRKKRGFVRECHGDLHLGNMVVINGSIRLFDCLEFNERLRWIDVVSEVAFLVMDFDYHGRRDLAFCFMNRYLMETGDYAGLELLPLYLVYRAMVRAKVACLRSLQSTDGGQSAALLAYLELARQCTGLPQPVLFITHGVSGSGKSWISERITNLLPAVHIRSDVERLRCRNVSADGGLKGGPPNRYDKESIDQNYDRLLRLAEIILKAGFSVVVDATFLQGARRERFRRLAATVDAPFRILDFQCAEAVLRERVNRRKLEGRDPSEATVDVLEKQLKSAQPLNIWEKNHSISIRSDEENDISALTERILRSVA